MPRVCPRFRFEEHPRICAWMEARADIQRQTVDDALENGETATLTLYPYPGPLSLPACAASGPPLRPHLRGDPMQSPGRPCLAEPAADGKDRCRLARDPAGIGLSGPADAEDRMGWRDPDHGPSGLPSQSRGWVRDAAPLRPYLSPSIPLKFLDLIFYEPKGVIGIDSNVGNLTALATSTGEIWEIDTGYAGKVHRGHLQCEIERTRESHNPKAQRKVLSEHRRIRPQKAENSQHRLPLALIAWAPGVKVALVLEDLGRMEERIRKGKSCLLRTRLMNAWSIVTFHPIRVQKVRFYRVPSVFVDPQNTSWACPVRGRR
jgi:hypothetical protein